MSSNTLSAAQLAQQNNRGPGGRYAEGSHTEAGDLDLEPADSPRGIHARLVRLADDPGAVDDLDDELYDELQRIVDEAAAGQREGV